MDNKYWLGIKPIYFVWHGEWSDPELRYNKMTVNARLVEDAVYAEYVDWCQEEKNNVSHEGFEAYARSRSKNIKELIKEIHTTNK